MTLLRVLLLVLACAAPTWAQDAEAPKPAEATPEVKAFLKEWAASMSGVKNLRVAFTQTKKLRILRRPRVSKGYTLMKGSTVLMVVEGKDGKRETELRVADGEARMHYIRQKRVEVFPVGDQAKGPKTPFLIFGGDLEALPTDHEVTLAKDGDVDVLTLVPREKGGPVAKTVMRFKEFTIVAMEQLTSRGDRLSLTVSRFERNPELKDEDLKLTTTSETKVIEIK